MTPGRCPKIKVPEIFIPLPVTNFVVNLVVARTAETHKVVSCVCATLGDRNFMMHFYGRDYLAVLLALFTQWVLADVSVTDSFPSTAVLLVDVRVTLVLVVLSAGYGSVVGTILSVCKVRTAGIGTRSFGSCWHGFTSYGIVRPACT